jgi:hypothetical protein
LRDVAPLGRRDQNAVEFLSLLQPLRSVDGIPFSHCNLINACC